MTDVNQQDIINRLSRVEGQVRGIKKMIEEKRTCEEIITQYSATKSALKKAGSMIMKKYLQECLVTSKEPQEQVDSLLKILEHVQDE